MKAKDSKASEIFYPKLDLFDRRFVIFLYKDYNLGEGTDQTSWQFLSVPSLPQQEHVSDRSTHFYVLNELSSKYECFVLLFYVL